MIQGPGPNIKLALRRAFLLCLNDLYWLEGLFYYGYGNYMKYFEQRLNALLLAMLALVGSSVQADDELSLLSIEAPPYVYMLPDGSLDGLFYTRMKCVLDKIQQPYSVSFKPWLRVQMDVENGSADGFFPAVRSQERDQYASLTNTIIAAKYFLYYLKDAPLKPGDPDFKAKAKVSSIRGTLRNQELVAAGYMPGPEAISFENLFDQLDRGRVEAILISGALAEFLATKRGTLDMYGRQFYDELSFGMYISNAFIKQRPEFLNKFNSNIHSCE